MTGLAPTNPRQMSNFDTVDPSVPPTPAPPERPRWRTLALGAVGSLIAVAVAVLIAASLIPVPYVILAPGQTFVATKLITVPSTVPTYPSQGEIRFVTVSERVQPTLLEKLQAEHDSDDQVLTEREVFGDQTKQQNDTTNQVAMTSSKDTAALVALRKLGFDVAADVVITDVVSGAPAAAVAKPGDIIAAIDGTAITSTENLRAVLGAHQPGDQATVTLTTAGTDHTETVTLGDNPQNPGHAFLGVGLAEQAKSLPFAVNIDTSQVGGPSAGLAFTLAILDVLTPGEITGGEPVAVTGTIDSAGNVGAIGGIEQKVVTVEQAGVKVFLVPADDRCGAGGSCNYTDAKRKAGDKLQVIPVANVDDALKALSSLGGNALALGEPGKSSVS